MNILKSVLYLYAFLIPFEFILEIFFGIDTVFKPYRLVAIIYLVLSVLIIGPYMRIRDQADVLLLGVYAIGSLISLFWFINDTFNIPYFVNYAIQTSLYILVFFISKSYNWSIKDFNKITLALVLGIIVNDFYAFFQSASSAMISISRVYGFMDNPNYFALGNCFLIALILFKSALHPLLVKIRLLVGLIGFSSVMLSGSRTAIVIVLAIFTINFIFYTNQIRKVKIFASLVLLIIAMASIPALNSIVVNTPLFWRATDAAAAGGFEKDVRLLIWEGAINAGKDTYFLGLGQSQFVAYENFKYYMSNVDTELAFRGTGLSVHNDYLSILVEYGVFAFFLYLLFLFFVGVNLVRRHRAEKIMVARDIIRIQILMFTSLLLFSTFSDTALSPLFWFLLFIVTNKFVPRSKKSGALATVF